MHTLLEMARTFIEEEKPLHALQLYVRLMDAAPAFEEPYVSISRIYAEWGQFPQAEEVLLKGYRRNPGNPSFVLLLGDLCARAQRFERAIEWYTRLTRKPYPHAHFHLALVYIQMDRLRDAEDELRIVLRLDHRYPKAHEALGEILTRRKSYSEAVQVLEQGAAMDPYSGTGHRLLGIALLGQYQFQRALEELTLAVDMDPADVTGWWLCGDTLIHLRRYDEAERYLQKALALDPHSPDASASMGFLCLQRGDTARALDAFDRALKAQPGHPRAMDGKLHVKIQLEQLR